MKKLNRIQGCIALYRDAVQRHIEYHREEMDKALGKLFRVDPVYSPEIVYEQLAKLAGFQESLCHSLRRELRKLHRKLEDEGLEPQYEPVSSVPGARVDMVGGMYRIQMDGMLPFAIKGSAYYLHEALDDAVKVFLYRNRLRLPVFTGPCVVVFLHHYSQGRIAKRHLRDYDNLERRCVLNVIARYFLVDDSPLHYISADVMIPDERSFTEVRIMSLPSFQTFLQSDQSVEKTYG